MSTCYLTTQGRILVAKMLASDRLLYTRAVTSAAVVAEPDKLTSMPMVRQAAQFLHCERIDDVCRLTVGFGCHDLADSYQLTMLGIYAKAEGDQREVLYKVIVYDTAEEQISLPAGADVTYKFIVTDAVSEGELSVEVVDDLAAPADHVYNPYRHLFSQTNSGNPATVDCGERNSFADGQKIVFVPKVALTAGSSQISCAGKQFNLECVDLASNVTNHVFVPNQTYVLTYRASDDCFFYTKHAEIEYKNGVGHIWNGSAWQTMIEAGRIIASVSDVAPAGTLLCDGSSVERDSYPELFSVLGVKFGAVDSDHFNLPNLGGRTLIGADLTHALGSMGGEESHQLIPEELPRHNHSFSLSTSSVTQGSTVTASIGNAGGHTHSASGTTGSTSHGHTATVSQQNAGGHTPTVKNVSISTEGSHRHLNGIIDDATELFNYGAIALSLSSHRAVAADSDSMPHPHTGYTSTEGSHSHSASITLNYVGDHGHDVRVSIPNGGPHTHPFTTTTGNSGSHSHPITVSVSGKAHYHTASGTTSTTGSSTAHNNMPPYMAIYYFIYTGRPQL
jgi:microcystin-dependent protein